MCGCGYALPAEMFFQVRLRRLSPSVLVGPSSFLDGGRSPKIVGACLRKGRATSSQQAAQPNPKTRSIPEPEDSLDTRTRRLARFQWRITLFKNFSQKEALAKIISSLRSVRKLQKPLKHIAHICLVTRSPISLEPCSAHHF